MSPKRKRALILFYDRYFTKAQFVKETVDLGIFVTRASAYDALSEFIERDYVKGSSIYGSKNLTITEKGKLFIELLKESME
jgi:DNA topoisomerase IA